MKSGRNVIAKDLRTPKYKPRVVKSKKIYNRKRDGKDSHRASFFVCF